MFVEEAKWIAAQISALSLSKTDSVANVGSSTQYFRSKIQPHIQEVLFMPLQERLIQVCHIDQKDEEGVDLVADVTQPSFGETLENKFSLVLCNNLLEHVTDIPLVCYNLFKCCQHGGHIIITVPRVYPRHEDPIDNMFRPRPEELSLYFPQQLTEIVGKKIVTIHDRNYYPVKKSGIPFWGYRHVVRYYFGYRHRVSGIVLQVKKSY
jgi:SAM-dependent methyltransferase